MPQQKVTKQQAVHKIAYVRWNDALFEERRDDTPLDPKENPCAVLHECGFLIAETESTITLSLEHAENTGDRWWLHIPKVNIVEMRTSTIDSAFPKRKRRTQRAPKRTKTKQ
jgi:hypothetical protein